MSVEVEGEWVKGGWLCYTGSIILVVMLKLAVVLIVMLAAMLVLMLAVALCRCSIDEAHPTNTHHKPR